MNDGKKANQCTEFDAHEVTKLSKKEPRHWKMLCVHAQEHVFTWILSIINFRYISVALSRLFFHLHSSHSYLLFTTASDKWTKGKMYNSFSEILSHIMTPFCFGIADENDLCLRKCGNYYCGDGLWWVRVYICVCVCLHAVQLSKTFYQNRSSEFQENYLTQSLFNRFKFN